MFDKKIQLIYYVKIYNKSKIKIFLLIDSNICDQKLILTTSYNQYSLGLR